jgi:hypothetical protein
VIQERRWGFFKNLDNVHGGTLSFLLHLKSWNEEYITF